ncbi:MAG: hypothetical protein DBX65_04470 [Oscillospiraceae bacterium]|nr:MAG: hypothetical protein DBX65_04470 [Oscillospiraceae bacterium]
MERKLRIGVFGGARGNSMIQVLLHHPEAELVAVCDKYTPLLDLARQNAENAGLHIACFESFDDFIQYDMDAVVLANYATEHATFAIRCLKAGKHVLSEVLPSETMAQAVELIETVEETGLVYAYAENYCYMDLTFEMWRRYREGDIGDVTYAEGEYIHDCAACWLDITYGDPNHWRNHLCPTFYCTHSLGPIMTITGHRPVQVVGFENPPIEEFYHLGHAGGHASGIEMVTLDNGATVKSIHGALKREPAQTSYKVFGTKGFLGTCADAEGEKVRLYQESATQTCAGENHYIVPEKFVSAELAKNSGVATHGGSDFYPTHFFIEKILGHEDGKWSIDVYQAVDMGICGILAFRSILNGNMPIKVPNLRNKEERDAWRHDNACTNAAVAGDQVLPCSSYPERTLDPEEVARNRAIWEKRQGRG